MAATEGATEGCRNPTKIEELQRESQAADKQMAEAEDEFKHALKKNMVQKAAFAFKVEAINQAMAEVKANMEEDQAEFTDAQCRKKLKRRNTNQEDEESCVDEGGKRRRQKEAREQLKGPLPLTEFNL